MSPKDANIITVFRVFYYARLSLACFSISVKMKNILNLYTFMEYCKSPLVMLMNFEAQCTQKGTKSLQKGILVIEFLLLSCNCNVVCSSWTHCRVVLLYCCINVSNCFDFVIHTASRITIQLYNVLNSLPCP